MRIFRMQWVLVGINLCIGIVSSLVIAVGGQLLGITPLHWSNIVYSAIVFTLILIMTHCLVFSSLILHPLQRLIQMAKFSGKESFSPNLFPIQIRELYDLAQLLDSVNRYLDNLAQRSNESLARGGWLEITPRSENDVLGKVFQRFINTLDAGDNYISEINKGRLFIEIPEVLQEMKLGASLSAMTMDLRAIIANLRKEAHNISLASAKVMAMSQQGSRNANTETQAVESISSSIQQVATNLREVMQNIKLQGDSLDKTFADIEDMLASIDHVNESVEHLSSLAEETFHSIGEIYEFMKKIDAHAHSLSEISETVSTEAKNGGQAVGEVMGGIQTIKNTVEEAAMVIQRLGEESGRIGEILEVINGVAEQTNLLALNASIIAAQAGEHGRGFAVVAGEIRELAERTRASTKEIGEIIRSLQAEVTHGTTAIQHCLDAVGKGVALANHSGAILEKIVESIQGARKMASSLAEATVIQTTNSQQVKDATEQVTQKLGDLYATATKQAEDSVHLSEMANILKEVTQHIDQSAITQLQATENIVRAIEEIQKLVQANAKIVHQLAASSDELGELESNLAESMGQFHVTQQQLPSNFDQSKPTIAFVRRAPQLFFDDVCEGIQNMSSTKHFQSIILDSQADPVVQAENANWLLQQPWLKGIIVAPVDEHTGTRLLARVMEHGIPIVVLDAYIENVGVSVVSDNRRGGEYAAEMLQAEIAEGDLVLVYGFRIVNVINHRMDGFFEKAKSYHWKVMEIFSFDNDIRQAKMGIMEGLNLFPNAKGVFLTNETLVLAYLELLREGKIVRRTLCAVGFDMASEIARAITDGHLLGTVGQDPVQLGKIATQELLALLQQQPSKVPSTPKEVLVPVKKITRNNLP